MTNERIPGSFRDPNGFLFTRNKILYREINLSYKVHYEKLKSTGLYDSLIKDELLIPHEETQDSSSSSNGYKIIKPKQIPFISYPYEWCFSAVKAAAQLVLEIQGRAIEHGMILKDANSFNVQFIGSKPIWIDTLSFELAENDRPWQAYCQFCQFFLAPLSLMSNLDIQMGLLSRIFINGIPLDLTSTLLPWKTYFNFGLVSHIHAHSKSQKFQLARDGGSNDLKMSPRSLRGLLESLQSTVDNIKRPSMQSTWSDYSIQMNYSKDAQDHKVKLVSDYIDEIRPGSIWDIGSNTGKYSRLVASKNIYTVSMDSDPTVVDINFNQGKGGNGNYLLPLIMDFNNPSPGLGWAHKERDSLENRGPVKVVMALALIHHLAIGNNISFELLADYFSRISIYLIIEFIPKSDSMVQLLLRSREDIFPTYNQEEFERVFKLKFEIKNKSPINNSKRTLYLMKNIMHVK